MKPPLLLIDADVCFYANTGTLSEVFSAAFHGLEADLISAGVKYTRNPSTPIAIQHIGDCLNIRVQLAVQLFDVLVCDSNLDDEFRRPRECPKLFGELVDRPIAVNTKNGYFT